MDYNNSFIFIKPTRYPEESFYYFLKNSSLRLLSDSSAFGFVYRCQFKKPAKKSPYFYLNSKGDTQDVTTIVIKCLLVNDRVTNTCQSNAVAQLLSSKVALLPENFGDGDDNDHYWDYKRTKPIIKVSKRHFDMQDRFVEEVRKQTLISKKGLNAMNRNCPVALFSKLFGPRSSKGKVLQKLLLRRCHSKEDRNPLQQMLDELSFRQNIPHQAISNDPTLKYYFGILAMENIDSTYELFNDIVKPIIIDDIIAKNPELYKYDSMALSPYSQRLRWAYNTARYELLRMAIDTGYSHGDYHTDNMLINEKTRKTMIIDFGRCKKIVDHNDMLELWNSSPYSSAKEHTPDFCKLLEFLFYSTFTDEKKDDEFMWIKGVDEEDTKILLFLHKMHNASLEKQRIDDLYDMMNDTNTYNGICTMDNVSGGFHLPVISPIFDRLHLWKI